MRFAYPFAVDKVELANVASKGRMQPPRPELLGDKLHAGNTSGELQPVRPSAQPRVPASINKRFIRLMAGLTGAVAVANVSAAVVVSGRLTSQAGNNGNPAVQQSVNATNFGTYSVGPLSGPQFGNNSTQGALIIGQIPSADISAAATGTDSGVYAANGATTFIQASITFDFDVIGPATGVAVPLLFGGSTDGLVSSTGDATRWNSVVGTRLGIISVGGVYAFHTMGPQSGTAADIYSGSVQNVNAGWGQMAASPVNYTSYDAAFEYEATVLSGQFDSGTQVLKQETILQGGTRGVSNSSGLLSTSSANSFLDATLQIDPKWSRDNPGYRLVMDSALGPPSAVPEPGSGSLLLVGVAALLGLSLRRHRQRRSNWSRRGRR